VVGGVRVVRVIFDLFSFCYCCIYGSGVDTDVGNCGGSCGVDVDVGSCGGSSALWSEPGQKSYNFHHLEDPIIPTHNELYHY